jgi:hypothetical protein
MQTKLTLRLDEQLIERAKPFTKKSGKSLSQIVADYFVALESAPTDQDKELTPIVRSLKGALRGAGVDVEDYRRHLEEQQLMVFRVFVWPLSARFVPEIPWHSSMGNDAGEQNSCRGLRGAPDGKNHTAQNSPAGQRQQYPLNILPSGQPQTRTKQTEMPGIASKADCVVRITQGKMSRALHTLARKRPVRASGSSVLRRARIRHPIHRVFDRRFGPLRVWGAA